MPANSGSVMSASPPHSARTSLVTVFRGMVADADQPADILPLQHLVGWLREGVSSHLHDVDRRFAS
ncbi:MAG: hypothetical protein HC848_03240 [Limnobacter sp.]|nr:hypothetical protein [Limnobacter sp.]